MKKEVKQSGEGVELVVRQSGGGSGISSETGWGGEWN